jgi:hypothetical protein
MEIKPLIGFTGTHGTGKTTAALHRARCIKSNQPEIRVGILLEVASECPWPINKSSTEDSQLWIFTRQVERELSMLRRYDLVVCDRTPADAIAYTWCLGYHALALAMMRIAEQHILKNYQQIIFRRSATNPYHAANGLRDEDPKFRWAVEVELDATYRRMRLPAGLIQYV